MPAAVDKAGASGARDRAGSDFDDPGAGARRADEVGPDEARRDARGADEPGAHETGADEPIAERADGRLKVSEVFHSLQGEALFSGWPTVFVRLTGCPLRCQYCDTAYAFGGGEWRTLDEILTEVRRYGARHVCVTGGEPLAQKRCLDLLAALCDLGLEVSLETSGAHDIGPVDARVSRIVDVKTPGSGEVERNRWENIPQLTPRDALKLVICDRADYEWARERIAEWSDLPCTVFFSPSYDELEPAMLAEWILEDRLDVRLQLQVHKLLWGNVPGR